MLKFIAYFKKKFNIKGFAEWLNYSIWNRAVFVYTSATLSIFFRYCLYSIHNGCWLPNYVTLYSVVFTYTIVTFFLFVFFILKGIKLGDFIRRFIDIDRIRENRLRAEKFRSLVVQTHDAHNSFKIYSYSYLLTFGVSFFLITMSSGTGLGALLAFCVTIYNLWVLLNTLYFARCMHKTIVPEELKTIKPSWLIRWEEFNDRANLMNGLGTTVTESATGSGLGKRVLNKASKVATKSFNYVTDPTNTAVIVRSLLGAGTMIVGLDYSFAEATQRTSYLAQVLEVNAEQNYSPDPDTRSKAAALRRRGFDLSDCCEPGTRCLNPELVENKYDIAKPYESKRYLALENEKIALENEKIALENEKIALENEKIALENEKIALNEKVAALEQENNKLNPKENSIN